MGVLPCAGEVDAGGFLQLDWLFMGKNECLVHGTDPGQPPSRSKARTSKIRSKLIMRGSNSSRTPVACSGAVRIPSYGAYNGAYYGVYYGVVQELLMAQNGVGADGNPSTLCRIITIPALIVESRPWVRVQLLEPWPKRWSHLGYHQVSPRLELSAPNASSPSASRTAIGQ